MGDGTQVRSPWKKNLYGNIGYPDNYTHTSFLQELKKNIHKQDVTLLQAILIAGLVTEKLCVVVVFSVIFVYLYNGWLEAETVFIHSNTFVSLCFIYYVKWYSPVPCWVTVRRSMKMVVIFLVFCFMLSPLLKTLTDTISTETIYATATFMMVVHMVFCNYKYAAAIVSSSLSLNAAIFSAVCLASRLQSSFHAFVFITLSAVFFVLYPYFSHAVVKITVRFLLIITLLTFTLVATVSPTMSILYMLLLVFINIICPMLFIHWQIYKDNIYGPWDEAIVKDKVE